MKKILIGCIIILGVTIADTHAQIRDTSLNTKSHKVDADLLFQKSKNRKTAAWILLGGGAGLSAIGLLIYAAEKEKNPAAELDILPKGTLPSAIGNSMMIASIPFFISAGKNKRKAQLIVKEQSVLIIPQSKEHLVSAGVKINL